MFFLISRDAFAALVYTVARGIPLLRAEMRTERNAMRGGARFLPAFNLTMLFHPPMNPRCEEKRIRESLHVFRGTMFEKFFFTLIVVKNLVTSRNKTQTKERGERVSPLFVPRAREHVMLIMARIEEKCNAFHARKRVEIMKIWGRGKLKPRSQSVGTSCR